jgi:hypothetical protein
MEDKLNRGLLVGGGGGGGVVCEGTGDGDKRKWWGSELDQSTLCVCVKASYETHYFVQKVMVKKEEKSEWRYWSGCTCSWVEVVA